jgi:hypothetical protein
MPESETPKWEWLPDISTPAAEPLAEEYRIQFEPAKSEIRRVASSKHLREVPVAMRMIFDWNDRTSDDDEVEALEENPDQEEFNPEESIPHRREDGTDEPPDTDGLSAASGSPKPGAPPAPNRGVRAPTLGKMEDANKFLASVPSTPSMVIDRLLHRGSLMSISGTSKSHKSFALLELAVSVATGNLFWGLDTFKGRVLYVNLELQDFELYKRLLAILSARGISLGNNELGIWNLRGHKTDIEYIENQIIEFFGVGEHKPEKQLSLIIIDPIYKCYAGKDENNAAHVAELFGRLESMAKMTNAAVVFAAHFAKGDSSTKAVIDRVSGSGVYGRYPDSILTVSEMKAVSDHYEVESVLRNFPTLPSRTLKWDYPLLRLCPSPVIPPVGSGLAIGRAPKYSMTLLVSLLSVRAMTHKEWMAAADTNMHMPEGTFKKYFTDAKDQGLIAKISDDDPRWYDRSKGIPVNPTSALAIEYQPPEESTGMVLG